MNIHLQICGIVITLFLLALYKSHSTLGLRGEKIFVRMLWLVVLCLSLDALSVVAIHFRGTIPPLAVFIICKSYLISMIFVGWINFVYVMLDVTSNNRSHGRMGNRMFVATAIEGLVVASVPIRIYEQGTDLYTYGPAVTCTYVFVLLYILFTLFVAIYIRRKKNSRRGTAVIIVTSCWILGAMIQMMNNELLLVGVAMAVGVMVLYIVMENPDSYLDRQLGCFNSYALNSYFKKLMALGTTFHVLDLSITNIKALEDRDVNVAEVSKDIAAAMDAVNGAMLFKGFSAGFVVVSEDKNVIEKISQIVMDRIAEYSDVSDSVMMFVIKNCEQFENDADLLKFMTYVRSNSGKRLSALVQVPDEMIVAYKESHNIEKEIDLALEEDRVEVYLQPIWDYKANIVDSAEALVRIRKPDGSMLSPGKFIPTAEATGQVKALGERVLDKVCYFIKNTDVLNYGIRKIHVNLSAVQCDDSAMAVRLSQIVEKYGVDPKYISFEITETAVSEAKDVLIENMNVLIHKGFSFSLDDFGKGESNLMYIVDMPVEEIKLDMEISKAYFRNPKAKPVINAVTDMASQLKLPIVAEGIEDLEELKGITGEDINLIQGYYYSRPLPQDEFLEYLKTEIGEKTVEVEESVQTEKDTEETVTYTDKRILLVEDNEMNREIAEEILEDCGFSVDTAEDGVIAVEKVKTADNGYYDLVLMDIRMPIMDGYEATRRIRTLKKKGISELPIIALTSYDGEEDIRLALESGMNEHLKKPLDISKLNEVVKKYL